MHNNLVKLCMISANNNGEIIMLLAVIALLAFPYTIKSRSWNDKMGKARGSLSIITGRQCMHV